MLAAQGEYRAAVRALFLGMLTDLLTSGDSSPSTPPDRSAQYLRETQRQQGWLVESLRPFVRLVEAIVYAEAPCRAAEYERARGFTDDIRRVVIPPQGATV